MGRISGISGISGLSGISGPHYFPSIIVKGMVSSIPPGGDLFFKSVCLHHPAGFWQNGGYPPDGAGCVTTLGKATLMCTITSALMSGMSVNLVLALVVGLVSYWLFLGFQKAKPLA